jgi:hypothetical protein|tara:strand:+ start:71 stop:460 length:390 start_codon:yes stop_codon:yes gene_type:complete
LTKFVFYIIKNYFLVTPDPPNSSRQTVGQEVEELAQSIGRLLRSVEPQKREDLKELAYALIREEMIQGGGEEGLAEGSPPRPLNPFGAGVLIFLLGGGLSIIFPPVGMVLMLGGIFFMVWGAAISWFKK